MSYPHYFSHFPNCDYALSINKAGKTKNIKIKDYFHRMTVRDDIYKEETLYYVYNVTGGKRPEQIAYEEYGDESYYWIVLQVNDIVDYYNEWPLSSLELEDFIIRKYGSYKNAESIHHYETVETRDINNDVVLEEGIVVSEDFKFEYEHETGIFHSSFPVEITNRLYEYRINDKKSRIYLLKPEYISDFVSEYIDYANDIVEEQLVSEVDPSNFIR